MSNTDAAIARARHAQRLVIRASNQAKPGNTAAAQPATITMQGVNGGLQRHAVKRLPSSHRDMHIIDRMAAAGELDRRLYANAQALLHLWNQTGIDPAMVGSYEPRIATTTGNTSRDDEASWHTAMRQLQPHQQQMLGALVRNNHPGVLIDPVRQALSLLDHLTAQHDGEMWRSED